MVHCRQACRSPAGDSPAQRKEGSRTAGTAAQLLLRPGAHLQARRPVSLDWPRRIFCDPVRVSVCPEAVASLPSCSAHHWRSCRGRRSSSCADLPLQHVHAPALARRMARCPPGHHSAQDSSSGAPRRLPAEPALQTHTHKAPALPGGSRGRRPTSSCAGWGRRRPRQLRLCRQRRA